MRTHTRPIRPKGRSGRTDEERALLQRTALRLRQQRRAVRAALRAERFDRVD